MRKVIEASMAMALGVKRSRAEVIPIYPITPQTHIVERLAKMVHNGDLDARIIRAESEHSAASALLGASATGARAFTASSSQGLALMFEMLPIISGLRLPPVMAVANRALSAPINIWNDHSDSVSARDQGWIQFWAESSQEALDTIVQAFKVSEDKDVLLPSIVNIDGYTLSHVYEPVEIPSQKEADSFLPPYKPLHAFLDPKKPLSIGPIAFPDSFMEFKEMQQKAMEKAETKIVKVHSQFGKGFGRRYGNGLIEKHKMEDAEFALIGQGSLCGTARIVVDKLRNEGVKAGLIRLRVLRPFPAKEIRKAAKNLKGLAVIDRHISLGMEGALFTDVKSALFGRKDLVVNGFIAGLGGRDIMQWHLKKALKSLKKQQKTEWLK